MQVLLAQPRGFCAGVERAIAIVDTLLEKNKSPVYVRHEIVHNRRVVEKLKNKGVKFVEEVDQIPNGSLTVFSAHGVSKQVKQNAKQRNLTTVDATCPLVTKVHSQGQRYAARGYEIILIGHEYHPEVQGTIGQISGKVHLISDLSDVDKLEVRNPERVAFITQTTLSVDDTAEVVDALKVKFPKIVGPDIDDICYATQNRQNAVRALAKRVDLVLVVGATNSSNSNRLCEVSRASGTPTYLLQEADDLKLEWLEGKKIVGISAGASTPEELVEEVIAKIDNYESSEVSTMNGIDENVHFNLPKLG
ncbi:MAG: 4-hydroxy-3-methylbut-2-enyl diphosphate reductase [Acidiferrobacterales bacterium]|nr:4-hydroxy-3-methylbut-2-enyl diphosphate reductase [Acidiferrobacterales bacterium]